MGTTDLPTRHIRRKIKVDFLADGESVNTHATLGRGQSKRRRLWLENRGNDESINTHTPTLHPGYAAKKITNTYISKTLRYERRDK